MIVNRTASVLMSAILLKLAKKSGQTRISLISGKFRASTCTSATVLCRRRLRRRLETREGKGSGHVAELPQEEPELRDDDGEPERNERDPRRVLHQPHRCE